MGILRDAVNNIGRGPDAPTTAFDPRYPNHRMYAEGHRMIFRIVHKRTGAVLREHAMVVMPESYTRTPEARLTVHDTAGGHVVDIPRIDANGKVHYVIQGTTGVWPLGTPRAPVAQIPSLGDIAVSVLGGGDNGPVNTEAKPDGMAAIKDLKDLVAEYLSLRPCGRARHEVQLEFYNPDEPIDGADPAGDSAYVIVPMRSGVETSRSARSPSLWRYSFRFAAIARPDLKPSAQLAAEKKTAWWQDVLGVLNDLNAFSFDALYAQYQLFAAPLTRTVAKIGDIRRLMEGWGSGVGTFLGFHEQLLREAADELRALTEDIGVTLGVTSGDRWGPDGPTLRETEDLGRNLRRTAQGIGADPSITNQALTGEREDRRPIPVAPEFAPDAVRPAPEYPLERGQRSDRRQPRDAAAGIQIPSPGSQHGTRQVRVMRGDALEDFVPPGWTDAHIIALNNLRFPFVEGNQVRVGAAPAAGDPRVAYIGEYVLVPVPVGAGAEVSGADATEAADARRPGVTEDEHLFGRDLYVNPDTRCLELDGATGDVRTVGGMDNLIQALRHLLAIPVGALHTAPGIGSYLAQEAEGHWAGPLQARLNAIAAARTLRQDHRVERVRSLSVRVANGTTVVTCEIDAISGRPVGRVALAV